jgi:H3 lysine-79-specific histone-lysine N-methyltransferase
MGALNQKSKFKPPAPTIRVQRVPIEKPKQSKPKSSPVNSSHNLLQHRAKTQSKSASPYPGSSSADESRRTKRKAPGGGNSRSPSVVKFDSDDTDGGEDGDNDVFLGARRKKRRLARVDPNRKLRHPKIWTGAADEKEKEKEGEKGPAIIHAAELANLKSKCQPALRIPEEEVGIELRYPGGRGRERYVLFLAQAVPELGELSGWKLTLY